MTMDVEQFCRESGRTDAPPLILLHGNGEDSSYFEHQMGPFGEHFHVYALDSRGHGRTPRGEHALSIRQFAEDLRNFMDDRCIERADILGFSDGGNVALVFAMRWPERVNRLIANGANLDPSGVKRRYQIPVEIGYRLAKLFSFLGLRVRLRAEILGLMVNDPDIAPEELAAITARTLVLAGMRDMIRAKHTRLIADSIPGSTLTVIPGDHFIAAKEPEAFNRTVLEFLED